MRATEYNGKTDKVKTSLILHCIGKMAREVCNTFACSSTEDPIKYNKVLEQLEAYSRFKFSRIDMNEAKIPLQKTSG